ncbi:hypothetical protein Pla52o_19920 [Novipirellula galeiformis]|uniref:Uncharacterized protein n=1 Tax=Novipirellula galeiformis TaxID=2528004 RepID=A0A5C6CMQ0_9BACT|nr:hypothetical protein [Novipirellula galeiformis]TWU24069.1 hypothetical protein Pla52o_19920 [Novipirellula galeiformis]
MPISGLVVTLSDNATERADVLSSLRRDPRIELGINEPEQQHAVRIPIVVDTPSNDEDKQVWQWLNRLPGVVFVDVALVGFESDSTNDS